MAQELNDQNFAKEAKEFKGVVLIDFYAPWCGPCKMQGPIIDELAEEFKSRKDVKIVKVNVDESQTTAQEFSVMSIPTLKILKDGKAVEEMMGLQQKDDLVDKINKHLK
ncbi:thioredoxin [bacterium]|jgi:thioredoxin 1|nr:thioredoxin [bacterium]MBT4649205.1 thioredoxin [bacterium]